jgi:hypothetical protein
MMVDVAIILANSTIAAFQRSQVQRDSEPMFGSSHDHLPWGTRATEVSFSNKNVSEQVAKYDVLSDASKFAIEDRSVWPLGPEIFSYMILKI